MSLAQIHTRENGENFDGTNNYVMKGHKFQHAFCNVASLNLHSVSILCHKFYFMLGFFFTLINNFNDVYLVLVLLIFLIALLIPSNIYKCY